MDPVNIQGLHNLCVVYVERGRLLQAQSCLKHAHELAPTEDYILRHLHIIQNRIAKIRQQQQQQQHQALGGEEDPSHTYNPRNAIGEDRLEGGNNEERQQAQEWQQIPESRNVRNGAAVNSGEGTGPSSGNGATGESPEAQSKGNKGNGGGHLKRTTTQHNHVSHEGGDHELPTYDTNGQNMAAVDINKPRGTESGHGHSSNANSQLVAQQETPKYKAPQHELPSSNPSLGRGSGDSLATEINRDQHNPHHSSGHQAGASVHAVNQKLEFTFANFDPREFSGDDGTDRLYLADDDHYSHEIKKNNALNQNFNNHNYYGNHPKQPNHYGLHSHSHHSNNMGHKVTVEGGGGGSEDLLDHRLHRHNSDDLVMGIVDDSAHSVSSSGMIGRPGANTGSSVLIDKELINDMKRPKPVAIGDTKFPPVNSKG